MAHNNSFLRSDVILFRDVDADLDIVLIRLGNLVIAEKEDTINVCGPKYIRSSKEESLENHLGRRQYVFLTNIGILTSQEGFSPRHLRDWV